MALTDAVALHIHLSPTDSVASPGTFAIAIIAVARRPSSAVSPCASPYLHPRDDDDDDDDGHDPIDGRLVTQNNEKNEKHENN